WLKTGDLGYLHPNGYLELKGRLKNMIVGPSGENIYPEDIEEVINSHSMVLESLVYELRGRLVAKVHLNYEALESKYADLKDAAKSFQVNVQDRTKEIIDEVRRHVNSKVATFSRLNMMLEQVEPFEKTPTHKIKRYIYTNIQQNK
ncbi:MAG: long-chain fatty acid--CoA ligase, partial [Perlabentimonas sp.]